MSTRDRHQQLQALRLRRIDLEHGIKDGFFILLGVASAGFGLSGFLLPNKFLDGGVMGLSLLGNIVFGIDLPYLVVLFNLPFVVIAYTQVARAFALKTLVAISLLALALAFIQFPTITNDKLLISVFGGFFLGVGIGLSIRGGSVIAYSPAALARIAPHVQQLADKEGLTAHRASVDIRLESMRQG